MAIKVKEVPIEAHNNVTKVKQYHAPLHHIYTLNWSGRLSVVKVFRLFLIPSVLLT